MDDFKNEISQELYEKLTAARIISHAEVIKGLECCKTTSGKCRECAFNNADECIEALCRNALAVIEKLKAENTQLKAENERLQKHNTEVAFMHLYDGAKECIERIKEKLKDHAKIEFRDNYYYLVGVAFFENVLMEMGADTND